MKTTNWGCALIFLLVSSGMVLAQDAKPAEHRSIAQVMDHAVSGVENEFVSAADAMPEDKYSFAPTNGEFKGVRTFAQQVKHIGFANHLYFGPLMGETID